MFASRSHARAIATGFSRTDHVWIPIEHLVHFHKNEFDETLCKLDSTENRFIEFVFMAFHRIRFYGVSSNSFLWKWTKCSVRFLNSTENRFIEFVFMDECGFHRESAFVGEKKAASRGFLLEKREATNLVREKGGFFNFCYSLEK